MNVFQKLAWVVGASLIAAAAPAWADIYKCVDASGRITYTNAKSSSKGCTVLSRDMPQQPRQNDKPSLASESAGSFPRVDSATQQSRDDNRRSILQREMASEQKLLDEARRDALRAAAGGTGSQPASDKVQLHERNIESLKKEISKLK